MIQKREKYESATIATDDPNSESWGDTPQLYRSGSDMWIAGSYDPVLNLFYIGTSQAKPWVAASKRNDSNEAALYTNSTLAKSQELEKLLVFSTYTC